MCRGRSDRAVVALEMDSDYLVPFFFAHVEDHSISHDAGHVDEDIQLAEFPNRLIDDALPAALSRYIPSVSNGASPPGLNLRCYSSRPRREFYFPAHRHPKLL